MMHLFSQWPQAMSNIATIILILNTLLHVLFASAIARDVGQLNRLHIQPRLLSGMTWVLATLIGGILVVGLYWLVHHSALARQFKVQQ